jgi:hypothetical protein
VQQKFDTTERDDSAPNTIVQLRETASEFVEKNWNVRNDDLIRKLFF